MYYAYTLVSTVRQGEGVSLFVQRDAIARYAARNKLQIDAWFEDKESAAGFDRPVFAKLMQALESDASTGLLMHKIDRGGRNLRDRAKLGDLN